MSARRSPPPRALARALAFAAGLFLVSTPNAAAHVRWFVPEPNSSVRTDLVVSTQTALVLAAALAAIAVVWLADRANARWRLMERALRPAGRLIPVAVPIGIEPVYRWLPLVLALHVAVALLARAAQRELFVPNLTLPYTLAAGILALGQIVVALGLVAGAFTRLWAAGLAGLWLAGLAYFGPLLMAEHAYLLGIAVFLGIVGRGPLALDRLTLGLGRPHTALLAHAVPALRVFFGAATIWSGFTEKLWSPHLAAAFLGAHPFNLTASLPEALRLSDAEFAVSAGVGEVVLGTLLVSGLWPRLVALLAWVPFNLAIPFLGGTDLVGHLPIYGILVVLLVCGDGRGFAQALRGDSAVADIGAAWQFRRRAQAQHARGNAVAT